MKWLGKKLRELVEQRYDTQDEFCAKINVTRQAYSSWVNNNKIPSGKSLMQIAKELGASVADFFEDDVETKPQFMHMHNAKNSEAKMHAAKELAEEYQCVIRTANAPVLQQICDLPTDDYMRLALEFRALLGVKDTEPVNYGAVFTLATKLNICIVFRSFPDILKDTYAFHYPVNKISVIFVDTNAYVTDLIFILLHEICHAVRRNDECSPEEDEFCDKVADATQFPDHYLRDMQHKLNDARSSEEQIEILASQLTKFSLLGLYKSFERRGLAVDWLIPESKNKKDRIKEINADFQKKCVKQMKNVLVPVGASPADVCVNYQLFSHLFFTNYLLPQLGSMTVRFIAQIFDLPSGIDGQTMLHELQKMRGNIYDCCC